MSEETLNNLFAQARQEVPETSTAEVLKWIGGGTFAVMLAAWLMKFKILFISKPLVMISSLITVAGITAGTVAMIPSSEPKQRTENKILHHNSDGEKSNENFYAADSAVELEKDIKPLKIGTPVPFAFEVSPLLPFLNSLDFKAQFCVPATETSSFVYAGPVENEPAQDPDNIGEFHAIEISGSLDVILMQDVKNDVWIDSKNAQSDRVIVKNENGTLKISEKSGRHSSHEKVIVHVNLKQIDKLICSEACNVSSEGGMEFDKLWIEAGGACNLSLNVTVKEIGLEIEGAANLDLIVRAEKMTADLEGAADLTLNGEAESFKLSNDGAANLKGADFKVEEAMITSSGASDTKIHVTGKLDIQLSGAAKAKYKGTPKMGTVNVAEAAHLGRF